VTTAQEREVTSIRASKAEDAMATAFDSRDCKICKIFVKFHRSTIGRHRSTVTELNPDRKSKRGQHAHLEYRSRVLEILRRG